MCWGLGGGHQLGRSQKFSCLLIMTRTQVMEDLYSESLGPQVMPTPSGWGGAGGADGILAPIPWIMGTG